MNRQGKSRRERIEYARSRSILDVARDLGMELFRSGKDYRWKEHDSLVINPDKNLWNWFSREGEGGDVIALVESMKKVDFNQAIDFLNDGQFKDFQLMEPRQEEFNYYLESYEKPLVEGRQFLKEQRGLSDETIDFFLKQGVISQANAKLDAFWDEGAKRLGGQSFPEPVIVFKSLSSSKELVGASLQGIEENWDKWSKHGYAKVILKNSDSLTGFHVDIGQPKRLVFAESPIDLMSYYQLKRSELADVRLVSMNGLKESTISYHLAQLEAELSGRPLRWTKKELEKALDAALARGYFADGKNQDKITLAVDNDEAGRNFVSSLQRKGVAVTVDLPPILEEGQLKSDWNDVLKKQSLNQGGLAQEIDYQSEVDALIASITQDDSAYYLSQDEELLDLGVDVAILEEFHGLLEEQRYEIDGIPLYVEDSINDGATGYLSLDGSVLDGDGIRDYLAEQGFSEQRSVEFLTKLEDQLPEIWEDVLEHYNQAAEKIIEKYNLEEQQQEPSISQVKTYDEVKQENEQLAKLIGERIKEGELTISFDTDVYLYDVFKNLSNSHPTKYINDKRLEILTPLRPILESIDENTINLYKEKGTMEQDSLYQALKPHQRTLGVNISTRFIGELAIAAYNTNKQVKSLSGDHFGYYYGAQTLDNLSQSIERILEYPLIEAEIRDYNYGFVTTPNAFYHYLEEQDGDLVLSRSDLDLLMARIEEQPLQVVEDSQEKVLVDSREKEKSPEDSQETNAGGELLNRISSSLGEDSPGTAPKLVEAKVQPTFSTSVDPYSITDTDEDEAKSKEKSPEKTQEIMNDRASVGEGSLQLEAEGSAKPVAETATFEQTVTSHPTSPYHYPHSTTDSDEIVAKNYFVRFEFSEHDFNYREGDVIPYETFARELYSKYHFSPAGYYKTYFEVLDVNQESISGQIRIDIGSEWESIGFYLSDDNPHKSVLLEKDALVMKSLEEEVKVSEQKENALEQVPEQEKSAEGTIGDFPENQGAAPLPEANESQPLDDLSPNQTQPQPLLHFTINEEGESIAKRYYHPISSSDLTKLNRYAFNLQQAASWYLDIVADSAITYFYQEGSVVNSVQIRFDKDKFQHLTGVFPYKEGQTAEQTVIDFANGQGDFDTILIANKGAAFDKLKVLPDLPAIVDASSFYFGDLSDVPKLHALDMSKAIKSKDEDIVLALRTVDETSFPASLMKLREGLKIQLEESNQERIILGVYRERDGVIDQLSINKEYVQDGGQEMLSILQNKQYEETTDVEAVQEVKESVDRSIEERLGINAANSLVPSIPQIQENLSDERNLLAMAQDDGRVLYTNQEDFGQEYQVELVVHSGIELNQLSEAQATWTLALIKGEEKLGYLAYGSDWGNDFQIENELENIAGQINSGKVLEVLYKQEEVEAFLASNIENTDDQEILSVLQNKQYEESTGIDTNQGQPLSISAEVFTPVLDTAYNLGDLRNLGIEPLEKFQAAWERYYELSDAHEGDFTAVVEAADQLGLVNKESAFYRDWSQDRIYEENYHVQVQWFENWPDGPQLPFNEIDRVDYQRFVEVLYKQNKAFYEAHKASIDIVNETGNQEAYIPYTKVKFDVYAPGGKLIKEDVRYNIGDETEPISRLLGMGYRRLEGYEDLAKMDEEILNQLENKAVAAEEDSQEEEESYALRRARAKLERLNQEFEEATGAVYNHSARANGQPMNDKRGGAAYFKRQNQLEGKVFTKLDEIKKQEERVAHLEDKERWKKEGLNRRGTGLDISVENIPLIEAEIAKAEKGEGSYSRQTIKRYKTELVKLKAMKEKMENVTIHPKVQELIDAEKLSQWKKQPTMYFVKGMRKVALELTDDGQLQLPSSGKFHPKTVEDKDAVQELLSSVSQENEEEKELESIQDASQGQVKEEEQPAALVVEEEQAQLQTEKVDYSQISPQELSEVVFQKIREFSQDPEALKEYLDFMSRFPQLSPRNAALIQAQWPGANAVATYRQWQNMGESLGITPEDVIETKATYKNKKTGEVNEVVRQNLSVKVGEKAKITLFRPIMVDMIPVLDEQGRQMKNDKGNPQYKKLSQATPQEKALVKEGKLPVRQFQQRDPETGYPRYTTYKVFELSQTTLKPEAYPKAMPNRHYDFNLDQVRTKEVLSGLCDYSKKIGIPIVEDDAQVLGNAKGGFDIVSQQILLNKGNTPGEMIGTTIHELAHATLHNPKFTDLYRENIGKAQQELEAEMTSYLVSNHFGLDTSEKAISHMASWTKNLSSLTDEELTQSMKRIHQTTARIVQCVEQHTKPYSLAQQITEQRTLFQEKKKGLNP